MPKHILVFLFSFSLCLPGWSQVYPSSASTRLYLGHLVDGGPAAQKWQTTVIVGNPNGNAPAPIRVSFYGDSGQPLPLDFGQGPAATLSFTVPAHGVKVLTSLGASSTPVAGWAILESSDAPAATPPLFATPVTATVLYRATLDANRVWDVASSGTGSTYFFFSYANGNLGVALANPNPAASIHLQVVAGNENGARAGGPWAFDLPPLGLVAFNLTDARIGLPPSFSGQIGIISTDTTTPSPFVALTLNYRDPVLSPLPPGEMSAPGPYDRRPYDVHVRVRQSGLGLMMVADAYMDANVTSQENADDISMRMGLAVDADTAIKASYNAVDNRIHLSTGLVEMLGTNDAALAFIIAHLTAHGIMRAIGMPRIGIFANDAEGLADAVGEAGLMGGWFDPGGAADFFARLLYAVEQGLNVDDAMRTEFGLPNGIPARLQKIAAFIQNGCETGDYLAAGCPIVRGWWHPHNPANVP